MPSDLAQQLAIVAELIRTRAAAQAQVSDALALVRIVRGLNGEQWEEFASTHDLSSWLPIPMNGNLADSVESVVATLEKMAFQRDHDLLTGLANRRLFEPRLEIEIERAIRSGSELCLLMMDLDGFKNINDTYGHAAGDMVLKRFGTLLKTSVRPYDIAARVGGEEFAVIFPSTSCWTGATLGNRILESFIRERFQFGADTFEVTFSAGVSSLALLEGSFSSEKLVASADEALYTAKNEGKKRLNVFMGGKRSKDRASLVRAQEKQFLFAYCEQE